MSFNRRCQSTLFSLVTSQLWIPRMISHVLALPDSRYTQLLRIIRETNPRMPHYSTYWTSHMRMTDKGAHFRDSFTEFFAFREIYM